MQIGYSYDLPPPLSRKRKDTHGVSDTKDVFSSSVWGRTWCPSCCESSPFVQNRDSKVRMQTLVVSKGVPSWGCVPPTSVDFGDANASLPPFWAIYFFSLVSSFRLLNSLDPGVSLKRVTTEMMLHFISWLSFESYVKSRVSWLYASPLWVLIGADRSSGMDVGLSYMTRSYSITQCALRFKTTRVACKWLLESLLTWKYGLAPPPAFSFWLWE